MNHLKLLPLAAISAAALLVATVQAAPTVASSSLTNTTGVTLVATIDADHDGVISARELANASANLLALDADADGELTRTEFHVPAAATLATTVVAVDANGTGFTVLATIDVNLDGTLQPIEITHATASLSRLDANRDGALSASELGGLRALVGQVM